MLRRPRTEEDFARLEYKFFAQNPQPIAKSSWEVFATFTVGLRGRDIAIEFVEEGELYGLTGGKPRGTRREAQSFISDLVFTPPAEMIKKVVAWRSTARVAYYLHNGLQVVDDMQQELAVHIMRDELLALNLVQRFITVRAAKKDADYVKRIPHSGEWELKVQEVLDAA
jgi:hypothetical protein